MKDRHSRQQGIVLSNREVVALGVGSLVVLGVVFYLGVSVGKGLAPAPEPATSRTLEDLDRQAETALGVDLTFPETLTEEEPRPARREAPAALEPTPAREEIPPKPREREVAEREKPAPEPEQKEPPVSATRVAPGEKVTPALAPKAIEPAREGGATAARYTVQLASFPSREEAEAFSRRVREAGLSPRIVEAEIPGKGTYFRVRVGSFDSREEATHFLEDLRRKGRFDGIVMPVDGR